MYFCRPDSGQITGVVIMSIDNGLLPEDFTTRYHRKISELNPKNSDRIWYTRLGQNLVRIGSKLCHVKCAQRLNPRDPRSRDPLWSDLLYYFHIYFSIKLLIALHCQYAVDYHKHALVKFDQVADRDEYSTPVLVEQVTMFRHQLVTDYEKAICACKLLGAPFMNYTYTCGIALLYLGLLINFIYLIPQFYSKLDLATIYLFVAPLKLQHSIDSLICGKVNEFILSSRTYHLIYGERGDSKKQRVSESANRPGKQPLKVHSMYDQYARHFQTYLNFLSHNFLVEKVKYMAFNGKFQPYNRREHHLMEIADIYGLVIIVIFPGTLFIQALFGLLIPHSDILEGGLQTDMMDILFYVEMSVYTATGVCSVSVYASCAVVTCIDQVYYVSKLGNLINDSILENTYSLRNYLKDTLIGLSATLIARKYRPWTMPASDIALEFPPANQPGKRYQTLKDQASYELVYRKINLTLMQILIQYKIFVKQLRSILDTIQVYITIALILMFVPPVGTRIFIAYLNKQVLRLSILACVIVLISVDISLAIICWLHKRCLGFSQRLHSLMAHTVAMDRLIETQIDRKAYDEHLIEMLHRELSHPDRLADQFSTRLLFGQTNITYESILRFHFWWGILVLSILVTDYSCPGAKDIFGGVWKYYRDADADVERFFSNLAY